MNSDFGFLSFLKSKRTLAKVVFVALLGIVLLVIAGGASDNTENASGDELAESVRRFCESVDGVGECRVIITYTTAGDSYYSSASKKVYAVAISCEGAKRDSVKANLTELISSMFGIGANRVSVLPLD